MRENTPWTVPSTLAGYLHGGGYMNFSGLLLSRAFLMWLRPTPLAPAEKEGWMLEPGSEKPAGDAGAPRQFWVPAPVQPWFHLGTTTHSPCTAEDAWGRTYQ